MSDMEDGPRPTAPQPPPPVTAAAPRPQPRNGFLTVLMVIAGIIMLLPGLCAVFFGVASLHDSNSDFMPLILIGLLVGLGGVFLIRAAIIGARR